MREDPPGSADLLPGTRFAGTRVDYRAGELRRRDLASDPFVELATWLDAAVAAGVPEPTAMVLATVTPEGLPAARTVLLRGLDARGLTFFTHYESDKGRQLAARPHAAVCFFWSMLHRQVRVVGRVERVTPEASAAYFAGRPRASQLGAWSSPQSQVLTGRHELDERLAATEARFAGADVPLPPFWGGYRVLPESFEFWQGRPSRLHDRFRYLPAAAGWRIERLAP